MFKAKRFFTKMLVSLLIILTLFNFISSASIKTNYTYADDPPATSTVDFENDEAKTNSLVGGLINGIVGAILNFFKLIVVTPIRGMRTLNYTLASSGGTIEGTERGEITPFDIFFNKFALLDANIFSTKMSDGVTELDPDGIVYKIRINTSIWYYAIRTLAITVVGIMLLWNLIRALSKSSSAGQKVIAKNALIDWVLSFALIMFMHIIIIVILNINDLMLNVIQGLTAIPDLYNFVDALENVIFADNLTLSIAAIVVYALLEFQTFKYIIIYIHRLLSIVLLVLISPLVPVTYSTDRMRGGRGAALNGWLKELVYNVFIQSVHALIYCAIVGVSLGALVDQEITTTADLGVAFVAVASMLFIKYAEKLVKTIFGFNNSQILNTNVFSDTATFIAGAGRAVGRSVIRVSQGGPLISFGQNVDGSHIGIGQVAEGLGNSARKTWEGAKDIAGNVITGGGNAIHRAKDIGGNAINRAKDIGGNVVQKGSDFLDTVEDHGGIVEYGKEKAGNAVGKVKDSATVVFTKLSGKNSSKAEREHLEEFEKAIGDVTKKEEQEKSSQSSDIDNKSQIDNQDEKMQNTENNVEKDNQNINKQDDLDESSKETKTHKEEEVTETIHNKTTTVEEPEDEENRENRDEENRNEESEDEYEHDEHNEHKHEEQPDIITVGMSSGTNPELLDKFKDELKAILNDDKETIGKWADEAQEKWDLSREKINPEEEEKILDFFSKNWNDKGKIQDYINSFKEGSAEREYADALGEVFTFVDIDDESQLSKEDKIKSLVDSYNSKGLEIPPSIVMKMRESEEVDKLTTKEPQPENKETNENKATNETKEIKETEEKQSSKIESIESIQLKGTARDLMKLGVDVTGKNERRNEVEIQGRSTGNVATEVEEKIKADFSSRIEETARKYDISPDRMNLDEIKRRMSREAQEELQKYNAKRVTESNLSVEAKNLAILEKEARYLGFQMEQGRFSESERTTIESNVDGGPIRQVSGATFDEASSKVIGNLAEIRKQREASQRENQNNRRTGTGA